MCDGSEEKPTLGLCVSGPALPECVKGAEQSLRLQLFLLPAGSIVIVVVLQRPGRCTSALWAALQGQHEIREGSEILTQQHEVWSRDERRATFLMSGKRISAMVLK